MTLTAFYEAIDANYSSVLQRMGGMEKMVDKFVRKFPNDTAARDLFESYEKKDYETAFRMAHTLKGVCMNLGFDKLCDSSSELTEALRGHVADNADELLENVRQDYEKIIELLKDLD